MIDSFIPDDPINREVWERSRTMQSDISQRLRGLCDAQQAMPKRVHEHIFSAANPLPWVPDLVGTQFGSKGGVLIVGSSYNGFIRGYSSRSRVMALQDYVACRDDKATGLKRFVPAYIRSVVEGDEAYYQPILRDLLGGANVCVERVCLTDLCKASFVQHGDGSDTDCRGDIGKDNILKVEGNWNHWTEYVCWPPNSLPSARIPYKWIWSRMLQCSSIVALGSIAEYGILKIFREMADSPKAYSFNDPSIKPDHPTLCPCKSWKYARACSSRKLGDWLKSEDLWRLEASENGRSRRWSLLPVYHPAAANFRKWDVGYQTTLKLVERMSKIDP